MPYQQPWLTFETLVALKVPMEAQILLNALEYSDPNVPMEAQILLNILKKEDC